MSVYVYGAGALVLLFLVGLKKYFIQKQLLSKSNLLIDAILFFGCFSLLGAYFYEKRNKVGMLAVGMGAVAIGKYLYDKRNTAEGEDN